MATHNVTPSIHISRARAGRVNVPRSASLASKDIHVIVGSPLPGLESNKDPSLPANVCSTGTWKGGKDILDRINIRAWSGSLNGVMSGTPLVTLYMPRGTAALRAATESSAASLYRTGV